MNAHTPGPWEIEDDGDVFNICADNRIIARVTIRSAADLKEDTANAFAMFAAPDLLAALREIENISLGMSAHDERAIKINLAARAAIAKAEGRT